MVSEKDVSYVADLAHLELTADERARMLKDLNAILGYIERRRMPRQARHLPMRCGRMSCVRRFRTKKR